MDNNSAIIPLSDRGKIMNNERFDFYRLLVNMYYDNSADEGQEQGTENIKAEIEAKRTALQESNQTAERPVPVKNFKTVLRDNYIFPTVQKLISDGWCNPSLKISYDVSVEKYVTISIENQEVVRYDKTATAQMMIKNFYKIFYSNKFFQNIPLVKLFFDPSKPESYSANFTEYENLFRKNKFLSFDSRGKMIDFIDWGKYPHIDALFLNVFKTRDRANYFVNWLAFCFQTLTKSGIAIISKGIQGSGKGLIYTKIIQYVLGMDYTTTITNESLKSNFNGDLENRLFVLGNELKGEFRESNTTYERLKMYITDPEIRFEEKNVKAQMIPNFFNLWIHSNNDTPLQIQAGDRRYVVWETNNVKLDVISEQLGFEHIKFFVKEVEKERDAFIYDIMSLKYDELSATIPMDSVEKSIVYESSTPRSQLFGDKLKTMDFAWFEDAIHDVFEHNSNDCTMHLLENDLLHDLNYAFLNNNLPTPFGVKLYRVIVDCSLSSQKIGSRLSSALSSKPINRTSVDYNNGKSYSYRVIDDSKDVTFTPFIPTKRVKKDQPQPIIQTVTKDQGLDIPKSLQDKDDDYNNKLAKREESSLFQNNSSETHEAQKTCYNNTKEHQNENIKEEITHAQPTSKRVS